MADFAIREERPGLAIEIIGAGETQEELLRAFGECRSGTCSCPTGQYEQLASMDVSSDAGVIRLRLRPKSGLRLDSAEIAACLTHVIDQAASSS